MKIEKRGILHFITLSRVKQACQPVKSAAPDSDKDWIGETMNARVRSIILIRFVGLVLGGVVAVVSQSAYAEPSLNEDLVHLSSGEAAHDQALIRLRQMKRKDLINGVRNLLRQPPNEVLGVRATSELGLTELEPDVEALVRETHSSDVLQVARVSQSALHSKLQSLLGHKKDSALKSTLIGKIKDALTDDEFTKLTEDSDYLVRESVVSQFFVTLATIPVESRKTRFQKLIALKPWQAREAAFKSYQSLSASEKAALTPAFKNLNCDEETQAGLKDICRTTQKESRK